MTKKRTHLEIIKDILEVIKGKSGKIKPTHILYKSNLSHIMMEQYLEDLKEKELITEEELKKGKTYKITERGLSFLSKYHIISEFMSSFGLNSS